MDLYELFEQIKKRPRMFFGHVPIKSFYIFSQGYYCAKANFKIPTTEQDLEFSGFQDWIEEKYKTTICHS